MQSSFPTEVCEGFNSYSYFSKTYLSSSLNVFISIELLEERIKFIHKYWARMLRQFISWLIWPNKCWVWGSRERGHWGRNWQVQMTSRIIKVRVPRSLMKELAARHFKNMTRKYAYQRPLIWYVLQQGCLLLVLGRLPDPILMQTFDL